MVIFQFANCNKLPEGSKNGDFPYGGFLKMGLPKLAGWFIRENPNLKWMIWGYPYFRTPPYLG
jgi:hypothetical protein